MNGVLGQYCSLPAMHKVSGKDGVHLHLEFTLQVMGGFDILTPGSSHPQPLQTGQGNSISISVLCDRLFLAAHCPNPFKECIC